MLRAGSLLVTRKIRRAVNHDVNVIMPHFEMPKPVEIKYRSKLPITPLVISLPGPVPY